MDHRHTRKIDAAVEKCRCACLGTITPLTNYWLAIEILQERIDWSEDEVDALRRNFVESLIADFQDGCTEPQATGS